MSFAVEFPSVRTGLSVQVEKENDLSPNVKKYALFDYKQGTTWLAFRDVCALFKKYVHGVHGIDYGCGAGRSTRFLRDIGQDPIGVDISDKMLSEARRRDPFPTHKYIKIKSGELPAVSETADFIFSSFVFLTVSSKDEMVKILREMRRVLKDNGSVIIATGSEKMHDPSRKWVSYKTDFPENYKLESGSLAKVQIKEVGAEFYDINWLDSDYSEVFEHSGFAIREKLMPQGDPNDGRLWQDEMHYSPYYVYLLQKALV